MRAQHMPRAYAAQRLRYDRMAVVLPGRPDARDRLQQLTSLSRPNIISVLNSWKLPTFTSLGLLQGQRRIVVSI